MWALITLITVASGLGFYVLRCRGRFWYEVVELLVALAIIFLTFYPQGPILLATEDQPSWWGTILSRGRWRLSRHLRHGARAG